MPLTLCLPHQQYSVYPIIWAAGRGHAEIVQVLLENGAKVNCSDKVRQLIGTHGWAMPTFGFMVAHWVSGAPVWPEIGTCVSMDNPVCLSLSVWYHPSDLGSQEGQF